MPTVIAGEIVEDDWPWHAAVAARSVGLDLLVELSGRLVFVVLGVDWVWGQGRHVEGCVRA
jgi:hypothetical protein